MQGGKRKSGIAQTGPLTWGTHFCYLYQSNKDLTDTIISFFTAGLENKESCCWLTSSETFKKTALSAMEQAIPGFSLYLATKQVEIITWNDFFGKKGTPGLSSAPEQWLKKLSQAQAAGFEGLRITGDAAWLSQHLWEEFIAYEEYMDKSIGRHPIIALCSYPLETCNKEQLIDVMNHHQFTLIRHDDNYQVIGEKENKRLRDRIQDLNSLLLAIRNINQSIVREKNSERLLAMICRNLAKVRKYRYVWLAVVDENSKCIMSAQSSLDKDFLPMVKEMEQGNLPGCTQQALSSRKAVIIQNSDDCADCPLRKEQEHCTTLTARMEHAGELFGALTVVTEGSSDEEEFGLLKEAADDIAFALRDARMEENLRKSEEKYRILVENAHDIVYSMTTEGVFIYASPSWTLILGHELSEVENHPFMEFVHPEDIPAIMEGMQNYLRTGKKPDVIDYRIRHKDGRWLWHRTTISRITDNNESFIGVARDITDRKELEEALRIDATRRRILMEQSSDGIVILDQDGGVYEANNRFASMLGYTMDEVSRLHIWDWDCTIPKERLLEMLRTVDEAGDHVETKHRRKDGSTYDVEINTNGVLFGENKLIMCVSRDVTERKRAEAAIRESEEKFARAFQVSPDVMVITCDGKYVDANEAFTRNTGYTREEVIGHRISEFNVWAFPEERERVMKKFRENGILVEEECHFLNKSGETGVMLFSMQHITIADKPCRLSVSLDITGRKQHEEALRISDITLKSIRDAVITLDNKFTVRQWNNSAEDIFGVMAEEAAGKPIWESIQLLEEYEGQNEKRMKLLSRKGWDREEQQYHTPRGDIWVDVHAQAIQGDGRRLGWVYIIVDVTERKKAEEEQKASYEREKALRESLEQETKKRVEFTRVLVHELKTPLTPILATSEILAAEMKEEPWTSMASNILRGGENLNRRIDELLDLAKGEIGMLKVDPARISTEHLLKEIVSEMEPVTASRKQSLTLETTEPLPDIRADGHRIRQVVSNLINNACKFTGDGGKITVRARQENGSIIVEVHDTGAGLTENEQARLFHPYERLEADRQKISGLGLGLALSKNLIELHDGKIWVHSQKDKGSVFGFSLPINGPSPTKNAEHQS